MQSERSGRDSYVDDNQAGGTPVTDDDLELWDLRDSDGEVVVPSIDASRAEMMVAVQAANTKQPEGAPHYATNDGGERIESDREMDESFVDDAIRRVEEGSA